MESPRKFADFSVGMSHSHSVHITAEMIAIYGDIVGDHNPLHTDAEFATPRFGGIIAHGTLLIGLFSAAMRHLLGGRCFGARIRLQVQGTVPGG
jgi:3-hydroxybutyryl-CoA dehydratase